jgi:hypothetical protein
MSLAAALPDVQDLADAIVAREVSGHPHPRALARALVRAAGNVIAVQESEEAAAQAHFTRWSKHRERAAKSATRMGTRR